MLGDKKGLEQKLQEEGGVVAWATVLDADIRYTSGMNYNNGPYSRGNHEHMTVKLRVEPDAEPQFEAKLKQTFAAHSPRPGARAQVIYDPNDHSKIAILEDQIFPPGVDPDKVRRSRERAKEAQAAAESGHMDEFIEKQKAEAMKYATDAQAQAMQAAAAMRERYAQTAPPAGTGGGGTVDVADELTKLAALRDRGVLTDAEFETEKAKLLGSD